MSPAAVRDTSSSSSTGCWASVDAAGPSFLTSRARRRRPRGCARLRPSPPAADLQLARAGRRGRAEFPIDARADRPALRLELLGRDPGAPEARRAGWAPVPERVAGRDKPVEVREISRRL